MFEWNEDEKKIDFSHNPFSMPQGGLEALDTKDPLDILAYQYDIVCNGIELSSGAIRNHRPDIMKRAFEIAGYSEDVLLSKFGGMYRAFQFGAPPHGGIAPGVDRIVMLLCGEQNLREVVLVPDESAGRRPADGRAERSVSQATARTAYPPGPAEDLESSAQQSLRRSLSDLSRWRSRLSPTCRLRHLGLPRQGHELLNRNGAGRLDGHRDRLRILKEGRDGR